MSPERPFLTAQWTELLALNFEVPADVVARIAPPGTEPDLFEGRAYASIVGFTFRDARLYGLRPPGHARFEEVNLRCYVCRRVDGRLRRGVVFVREIANRPAVAAVARWVYHESYVTRSMRSDTRQASDALAASDRVGYAWRNSWWRRGPWNRIAGLVSRPLALAEPGSLTEFLVDHYWAYTHERNGTTAEYRVAHRPWRVAPAEEILWDCDLAATYPHASGLAEHLAAQPVLAFVADGSPVQVFRGRKVQSPVAADLVPPAMAPRDRCVIRVG